MVAFSEWQIHITPGAHSFNYAAFATPIPVDKVRRSRADQQQDAKVGWTDQGVITKLPCFASSF
jgi:hypothetical protein